MKIEQQITELFGQLDKTAQVELLKTLTQGSGTSISIADFAIKVQKRYGSNLEFEVEQTGPDHIPTITAVVTTPFGDFEGTGSNQKIAKANACDKANAAWPKN